MLRVVRPLRERIALMEDHVARGQEALRQRTLEMEEERRKQEVLAAEKKGLNIQIQTQQTQLQAQGRDLARLRLRWGSEGTTILDNIAVRPATSRTSPRRLSVSLLVEPFVLWLRTVYQDRKLKVELREERFQAETLRENIAVMQTQADELRRIRDGLLKDVEKLNGVVDSRDMELKSVRARGSKLEEELSRAQVRLVDTPSLAAWLLTRAAPDQLVMMAQKEILTALHEAGLIPDSLMKQLEDVISGKTRPSGGHAAQNMSMQQQLHGMLQVCWLVLLWLFSAPTKTDSLFALAMHPQCSGWKRLIRRWRGKWGRWAWPGRRGCPTSVSPGAHALRAVCSHLPNGHVDCRMVANAMQQKHVQTALTAELKKVAGQATELISSLKVCDVARCISSPSNHAMTNPVNSNVMN